MSNKNYRVNIYLGQKLYTEIEGISNFMGITVPQMCKILLNTGFELSKAFDVNSFMQQKSEVLQDGKSKE